MRYPPNHPLLKLSSYFFLLVRTTATIITITTNPPMIPRIRPQLVALVGGSVVVGVVDVVVGVVGVVAVVDVLVVVGVVVAVVGVVVVLVGVVVTTVVVVVVDVVITETGVAGKPDVSAYGVKCESWAKM